MIPLAAFALGGCLAVGAASDRILAGDLAAGFPEWAAVPPETPLALAPAPGVERVLRTSELRRLAEHWNLPSVPDREVCVTRPVAMLTATELIAAMQRELPEARIELFDFGRQPTPEGELRFPLSGLRQGPGGGYWNGYVAYAGTHRFAVWARVKVRAIATRVIATQDLKPGVALDAASLRLETREEIPAAGFANSVEEAAGKIPRRAIATGTALRTEWLEAAKAVTRGETVKVEAVLGGARLELDGIAEGSGAIGETIPIQNPISKRRFRGRIESKGRVSAKEGSL